MAVYDFKNFKSNYFHTLALYVDVESFNSNI